MKKSLARKITLSILAGAVLMSSSVVWAAPVTGWNEKDIAGNKWYTPNTGTTGEITDGTYNNVSLAGNVSATKGDISYGKIIITGGSFTNTYVAGGITADGSAIGNEVSISGVSVSVFKDVYGGQVFCERQNPKQGDANKNNVIINDVNATFEGGVYGGIVRDVKQGNANKNTVTISAGAFKSHIYGGYVQGIGNANNNKVIIDTTNVTVADGLVYGGYTDNGNTIGNEVVITTTTSSIPTSTLIFSRFIAGGFTFSSDDTKIREASGNRVIIDAANATFKGIVYGGIANFVKQGNANENTVIINNGTFEDSIYGGSTYKGRADGNTVEIKGGTFDGSDVYGGYATDGSASNNTVSISGVEPYSTFGDVKGGYAENTSTAGDASNNTVIINAENGIFDGSIWGGDSRKGNANNNMVTLEEGTFKENIFGGFAGQDSADGNTVNIKGGTFTDSQVYGGYATNGSANNNTVTINGGTFNGGSIYGGFVSGAEKEAVNNTVNIGGNATLNNDVNIRGGIVNNADPYYGGSASPNTLNLNGWQNSDIDKNVGLIAGFDVINFNNCKWEDGETVVQAVNFSFDSDLKINVNRMTTEDVPNVGDEMTLIESYYAFNEGKSPEYSTSRATFMASGYERVIGEVYQTDDDKNIKLKVKDVSANEAILAFGESRAAASALTNQGSELIETGLDALARDNDKDTKVFAALYGNASEYETGSHVKVNGWNGIVGVGKTNANGVTIGAFFENGEGNYRTFNKYEGEFMRGDGEATYNGGGFLYRKDTASGVYTEASLRAGNLQNELRNAVIANDALAGYDIDTFYYGAHVGIGKVIPRGNEGDSIDVYGKFIYTHYDDEDFAIDGGKFHLDSIESERLRLGFRINEVQNNKLNMYYGAAWEYEFGGDSNNSVVGYDIDVNAPSLEGSTVIGEIGMHYKASEKWSLDLNGRAYVGQREGFSGSVQANYSF